MEREFAQFQVVIVALTAQLKNALTLQAIVSLALLLFADAATADLDKLKRFKQIPMRLLLIGLPLTILLGFGAGVVLFSGLGALSANQLSKDKDRDSDQDYSQTDLTRSVQGELVALGYDPGPVDGVAPADGVSA